MIENLAWVVLVGEAVLMYKTPDIISWILEEND